MKATVQWVFVALGILVVSAIGSSFVSVSHPKAQDIDEEEVSDVSEADLNLYIAVYSEMQADHDLTIEDALASAGHGMDLATFRELERRVQKQERLVERVRQALMDSAKARANAVVPTSQQKAEQPAP
jgi:hypothetical protein